MPIVKVYDLASDKSLLVKKQTNRSGIYLFTNKISCRQYVGSAINLGARFSKNYFSESYLSRNVSSSLICSALLAKSHSQFYVTIIEYVTPRPLLYLRETYYIAFF